MTKRLAYLGPPGTYSEQAALAHDAEAELLPFPSFASAAAAVDSGGADQAVLPIENSLEGAVTDTLDVLIHQSPLFIRNEIVVPIHHCLVIEAEADADQIEVIYSHPQSLAQCRRFLEKRFPGIGQVASLSNSAAVEDMQKSTLRAAAIAPERAAEIYGARVVERGVQDDPNNLTRFVVLATSDHPRTGADKTSICFDFGDDAPGILHAVLGEFSSRGINLSKIESRPTRRTLGRYIFLVDVEGHREDPLMAEALASVEAQVSTFKVFGSYPMHVSSAV